jgi:3'-phosphoadenosine 5'-phosphosulfate sulfotransferase (PAPS reductase)/FAD synthetase
MIDNVSMFPELVDKPKKQTRFTIQDPIDLSENALTPDGVASLTKAQREQRVQALVRESNAILDEGIDYFITRDGKRTAAIVGLFSGGNDSTTLCHVMLNRITHLAHANTTIGIEETREFVRQTARLWDVPLLEYTSANEADHYRALVLDQGFPGPGHHFKMYQRLKERALRRVRKQLVTDRSMRVIFLAGRRRTESARRAEVPALEREGQVVWVSPMVNWTKLDLNTYRLMRGDVPVNRVTDLIHMSGECLCGSFAHAGELDEIAEWFPDVVAEIRELEREIADRDDLPEARKKWGWGATYDGTVSPSGPLCSSCDFRYQQMSLEVADV